MEDQIASPAEVAGALQHDIVENMKMSIADAAKKMGKKPQTLYNILRGKSRVSYPIAQLLHDAFNYNVKYLTSGVGELREEDSFVMRIGEGDNAVVHVFGPRDHLFMDGEYFPRQRIKTEREEFLQRYCKLFGEVIKLLYEKGAIELDYCQLDDGPKFKEYGFNPTSVVEGDLFTMLTYYSAQIDQLTDLRRVLKLMDQEPSPQI